MVQEVAVGVEMCEPVAVRVGPALVLAGPRGLGDAVIGQDVVLIELAGSHLEVLAARWPGCCCCCWCRGLGCCCAGAGAGRPGAAGEVRLCGAAGAASADLRVSAL